MGELLVLVAVNAVRVDADLTQARVSLERLDWSKPAGVPAKSRLSVALKGGRLAAAYGRPGFRAVIHTSYSYVIGHPDSSGL